MRNHLFQKILKVWGRLSTMLKVDVCFTFTRGVNNKQKLV